MTAGGTSGDPERLTVGIALSQGAGNRVLLEGFCNALSHVAPCKAAGIGVSDYKTLLSLVSRGEVDMAWLPPILAMQAASRGLIVPIAMPLRGGHACYSAALFARPDYKASSVYELSNARAAWVDRNSAAGYLIIRAHLKLLGVHVERVFSSNHFVESHDAVVRAVLMGDADVGATYAYFDPKSFAQGGDLIATRAPWGSSAVKILTHAGPIPSDLIVVRQGISSALRLELQRLLMGTQHTLLRHAALALFGADGFALPANEHLRPLAALLSGLDADPDAPPMSVGVFLPQR